MSPLATYALRLGDDSLILGQRLGEWCGHAPALEVDLSLANVALDQIGQATHFLGLASALEGEGRDGDALAFRRDVMDFTNCLLVEQPNGDFAQTIARLFLFAHYQELLFTALTASKDAQLAAIAAKAVKETAYHATLASDWVVRLGDGTEESRARMIAGLDWMWRFADELFAMDDVDVVALKTGVGVDKAALRAAWEARVDAVLADATLERPAARRPVLGGRVGRHSEHLGHLLSEMQFLQRAYPGRDVVSVVAMITDIDRIRAVLADVPDPEIPAVSVVDLGIVREIGADAVTITPTYTGCPATLAIERMIRSALDANGFGSVAIETTLSPPWSTDWISDAGREKLRAYGIAPPPKGAAASALKNQQAAECPRCGSSNTEEISRFGSTPCKALWRCKACAEPFDRFKCH